MRHSALEQKPSTHAGPRTVEKASTGSTGTAIVPPAYGLESIDSVSEGIAPKEGLRPETTIQRKAAPSAVGSEGQVKRENRTGLSDTLKAGVESLSGFSLDDVRVHYNSPKPTQLQALAYAQGTEIHVAPGQERHLPHEAWHIVQQKQGRVQPTMQMKTGININDDGRLEREADTMGTKAAHLKPTAYTRNGMKHFDKPAHHFIQLRCKTCMEEEAKPLRRSLSSRAPVQRVACQGTLHDTSNEHRVIEMDYVNNINPNAAREFEIPQGSLDTYDNGTHKVGYADIADQTAHELYEIKRNTEAYPQNQLNRYITRANISCGNGWTAGSYYPSERIINFSHYENNMEIIARKDARPGFIRYEKRQRGGGLGIGAAMGGGVYVNGMANTANLPPLDQWVGIWTSAIWDSAANPESINPQSQAYIGVVQQVQQIVQGVQASLRGGMLDRDLLLNGWGRLETLMTNLPF